MHYTYECFESLSAKDRSLVVEKADAGYKFIAIHVKMNDRVGSPKYAYWFRRPSDCMSKKYEYMFSINYSANNSDSVNRKLEDGWDLVATQITMPEHGGLPNYIYWFEKNNS